MWIPHRCCVKSWCIGPCVSIWFFKQSAVHFTCHCKSVIFCYT